MASLRAGSANFLDLQSCGISCNMPRWLPESFYSTKLEMTPLGTKKTMTALFAVGLSLAVTAFCVLVWWFTTQSLVTETVVLAKLQPFYDGKGECNEGDLACNRMLLNNGRIPASPDDKDWDCSMLSVPPARPISYTCSEAKGGKPAGEVGACDGKACKCNIMYNTETATEALVPEDLESKPTFKVEDKDSSGYAKGAVDFKLTHKYQLYETHEECIDKFKCVAPSTNAKAKDIILHTEGEDVKGCLITGLGPSVTAMDRSIYLDLSDAVLSITDLRRRRRGLYDDGDYADGVGYEGADGSYEGNDEYADIKKADYEAWADYEGGYNYQSYSFFDDYFSTDAGYSFGADSSGAPAPPPPPASDTDKAMVACKEKWEKTFCRKSSPTDSDVTESLGFKYFRDQACNPFLYNHNLREEPPANDPDATMGLLYRGNPPYACTRMKPRNTLEAISLSFSFAEFFYMIVLFGMCRILWQAYLRTADGKKAKAESEALEKRLNAAAEARKTKSKEDIAAEEADVEVTLTRKDYVMFEALCSKMGSRRAATQQYLAKTAKGGGFGIFPDNESFPEAEAEAE